MVKVKLVSCSSVDPILLSSFAARTCYSPEVPEMKRLPNLVESVWNAGHHTVLEHSFFSFLIDSSVGDVTFGLHLVHPFYNSSQRSGRYSLGMFLGEQSLQEIDFYIMRFWPDVDYRVRKEILDYLRVGRGIFKAHLYDVSNLAEKALREERPFISQKNLESWTPRAAQEQLRVFIPIIFPTALLYTIDLVTLASLQRVAWSPSMRGIVKEMIGAVLNVFPDLDFIFDYNGKNCDWSPGLENDGSSKISTSPNLILCGLLENEDFRFPHSNEISPIDLLQFSPKLMDSRSFEITTEVEVSVMTFGQDQRHRMIQRSEPVFTGKFYLPPLLQEMRLEREAQLILETWFDLGEKLPETLWTILAPYGAMVRYRKKANLPSLIHEQLRRSCWRAQEEIHYLAWLLRSELEVRGFDEFLPFLSPPCSSGKCPEGQRYCGRDLKKSPFVRRKV